MRTSLAAAAMAAAALTVGGAAGAVLFTPTASGAQDPTAQTTDDERPVLTERLADALVPLVDDGTITQDQADAVATHLAEAAPRRARHHHHGHGHGHGHGHDHDHDGGPAGARGRAGT